MIELLSEEYPEGICSLRLSQDLKKRINVPEDQLEQHVAIMTDMLKSPDLHLGYGMKFVLDNRRDLVLNDDAITELFTAIATIVSRKPMEMPEMPEEGAENFD